MATITCARCGEQAERHQARSLFCLPCDNKHAADARRALNTVAAAIRRGDLPKASERVCVDCGAQGRDWDHRDYTKPLEVVPVCRSCNLKRGSAFDSVYRPANEAA